MAPIRRRRIARARPEHDE